MSQLIVYHYPACSTCKKALAWLMDRSIGATLKNIVETPPQLAELERALVAVGGRVEKLFNTSGQLYREGNYKEKLRSMTTAQALQELACHGKLIRRPLLLGRDVVLVGFKPNEYAHAFEQRAHTERPRAG